MDLPTPIIVTSRRRVNRLPIEPFAAERLDLRHDTGGAAMTTSNTDGELGLWEHRLSISLKAGRCPVCDLSAEADNRWLTVFLRERTTNGEMRQKLLESWGFCITHWRKLWQTEQQQGSHHGIGQLLEALAQQALDSVGKLDSQSKATWWRRRERDFRASPKRCPACVARTKVESGFVELCAAGLAHPDFRRSYEQARHGLCLTHLDAVLRTPDGQANRDVLTEQARRRMDQLAADLAHFVGLFQWQARQEPRGPEQHAPDDFLRWLVGEDWRERSIPLEPSHNQPPSISDDCRRDPGPS